MENPRIVERYGMAVWELPEMDKIRKDNCLCLHCGNLKPNQPDNCKIAQAIYENFCKVNGNAFIMTRCNTWVKKLKIVC